MRDREDVSHLELGHQIDRSREVGHTVTDVASDADEDSLHGFDAPFFSSIWLPTSDEA
jgi:hypothetical protein